MAERVFSNQDVRSPSEPLSPGRPLTSNLAPAAPERELPEHATPSSLGHIPGSERSSNPRLNSAAESAGRAVGSAVAQAREMRQKFTVIRGRRDELSSKADDAMHRAREAGEEALERARDLGAQAADRARELSHDAVGRAREWSAQAADRAREFSSDAMGRARVLSQEAIDKARAASSVAQERARVAGVEADRRARRYPLQVIAGAAVFGMLMGIWLRVWRDHAS